jgi:hypothetical protein
MNRCSFLGFASPPQASSMELLPALALSILRFIVYTSNQFFCTLFQQYFERHIYVLRKTPI